MLVNGTILQDLVEISSMIFDRYLTDVELKFPTAVVGELKFSTGRFDGTDIYLVEVDYIRNKRPSAGSG